MKKRIILPAILLTGALAVGTLGVARAYAQDSGNYPPVIQKLAEKFGVSADEVQSVFEEVRAEHQAEMLTNFEERLDNAVQEGKITAEQKQLILDKHEEMQAKMDALRDLDPEQAREQMKALHEQMQTWAEENGIDFPFVGFKSGFGKGFKMGHNFEKLE